MAVTAALSWSKELQWVVQLQQDLPLVCGRMRVGHLLLHWQKKQQQQVLVVVLLVVRAGGAAHPLMLLCCSVSCGLNQPGQPSTSASHSTHRCC